MQCANDFLLAWLFGICVLVVIFHPWTSRSVNPWAFCKCEIKLAFRPNRRPHDGIVQANGCSPKFPKKFWNKHRDCAKMLDPLDWISSNDFSTAKALSATEFQHFVRSLFIPVWIRWCRTKLHRWVNRRPHKYSQTNGRSPDQNERKVK